MKKEKYIQLLGTGGGDYHAPGSVNEAAYKNEPKYAEALRLGGKNVRYSASLFIAPDIIVDFGEGTRPRLKDYGIPEQAMRHLFITHGHYDHFFPAAIFPFAASLDHPLRVYGNTMVRDAIEFAQTYRWDKTSKRHVLNTQPVTNLRVKAVALEKPFRAGSLRVTPVLATHFINREMDKEYAILEQQAMNYIIERDGKTLFYGLDCSYTLPKTLEFMARYRFDIMILDASYCDLAVDPTGTGHHNYAMMAEDLAEYRKTGMIKPDTILVYSHLSTSTMVPEHEAAAERLAKQGIILGYDGLTLTF